MRIRKICCGALLASLAACGRPSGGDPAPASLSFRHSGVGKLAAGSYRAVGDIDPRAHGAQPGDWAYGTTSAHSPPRVLVESTRRHTDGGRGFDGATVFLPGGLRAGQTVPLRAQCEEVPGCASMTIEMGLFPNVGYPEVRCTLTSGSVRLTHVNDERVRGSFTGTAACDGFQVGRMQVERGSFDVPVVDFSAD